MPPHLVTDLSVHLVSLGQHLLLRPLRILGQVCAQLTPEGHLCHRGWSNEVQTQTPLSLLIPLGLALSCFMSITPGPAEVKPSTLQRLTQTT